MATSVDHPEDTGMKGTMNLPLRPTRTHSLSLGVRLAVVALALCAATGLVVQGRHGSGDPQPTGSAVVTTSAGGPVVRVSGNNLVNGAGQVIRLIGLDHSGTESRCIQGYSVFDPTDTDTAEMIAQMKSWNINTVRLPLNEDCWLGINMGGSPYGGAVYRSAIVQYVDDLNAAGLAVILDLHWNAPGSEPATGQQDMADEDHAPAFWTSVAGTFAGDLGVIFDLYNEPHDISWSCLVNGGCQAGGEVVAGYDQLIGDVRATGATNVVMVAGLDWANDPDGLETGPGGYPADLPYDPLGQLAVSVHVYNYKYSDNIGIWNSWLALASHVPLITGKIGENDCGSSFIDAYMSWADAHDISYLAWTYNAGTGWTCTSGPSLIQDYDGDATAYGQAYKNHLASIDVPSLVGAGQTGLSPSTSGQGYDLGTSSGSLLPYGPALGPSGSVTSSHPVVGVAATPDGAGHWLVASDGGVFTFGDARFYGSTGGSRLNRAIVGMAASPDGGGYWLVASDGGVFSFGVATFHGSTGSIHLNAPIVGMAATPDGGGYWLVASDGGIFSFGDARFFGSTGSQHLNRPIVGMAATPDGGGYWLVGSDGGVFSFGDAGFAGSTGGEHLNGPIVGMASTSDGGGYWLAGSDGGVYAMGDARFFGSASPLRLTQPVTSISVS
jgi:endoglucanase